MALSRGKKLAFALAAMALSIGVMLAVLLGADLVLHARAERSAGLNRHGYRGPVAGRKQPGERRVVMLGGSTVFGYGVTHDESIPFALEQRLRAQVGHPVSVVNLGFNNEGAYAFVPNLEDYAYLDYDVVCLYEGYNDLMGDAQVNTNVYRRRSAVFRLTGYLPILPVYLEEKAMLLRSGGDLNAAYAASRGENVRVVFRPNLAQRTSAGALDALAAVSNTLGRQLDRVSTATPAATVSTSRYGCVDPWVNYCESVAAAINFVRTRGKPVVVALQPRLPGNPSEAHRRQQEMFAEMLQRHFANDAGVHIADLRQAIDLASPDATFDAMHLTPAANAVVAGALADSVKAALASVGVEP